MGALVLEIVLGVMILATFFVAYMSAKTWQVYQVVLVVFIFLSCVGFFYLSARTLATHKSWAELIRRKELEITTAESTRLQLVGGEQDAQGVVVKGTNNELKEQLEKLATDRGGVVYHAAVEGVKEGKAQLKFESPEHGLTPKSVLFVFDETPLAEGGHYLGEFDVVTAAADSPNVEIAPNLPLTDKQKERLAASKGPWTLYFAMPTDDAVLFAGEDEAARQAVLPKEALAEYANRDRKLRDYELFFHENYVQRSLLSDALSEASTNIARTEAAIKETNGEIAFRGTEKTNLQADLEKFQLEEKAIAGYRQTLEGLLVQVRDSLKATFVADKKMADELTALQWQAADQINQRSATPPAPAGTSQ